MSRKLEFFRSSLQIRTLVSFAPLSTAVDCHSFILLTGSTSPPRQAHPNPAIPREGNDRPSSDIPLRSSASQAMPSWENNRHPVYHFAANAPPVTATSTIRKWRAESPGAWPAPAYYSSSSGKHGASTNRVRNSPPPPAVYRHGSMNSMERRPSNALIEAAQDPTSGLARSNILPARSARTSPQPGGSAMQVERQHRRATQDGDESAYWSGFEDGIQYERQRQAFEHRSGPYVNARNPCWYIDAAFDR